MPNTSLTWLICQGFLLLVLPLELSYLGDFLHQSCKFPLLTEHHPHPAHRSRLWELWRRSRRSPREMLPQDSEDVTISPTTPLTRTHTFGDFIYFNKIMYEVWVCLGFGCPRYN